MNTLVFDTSITGHHLEYIHHLYLGMAERKNVQYVIVIPDTFMNERHIYSWPDADNIKFDFLSKEELSSMSKKNILLSAWSRSKIVRKKVREHEADSIFLIMLMAFIPFILFVLPSKVKLSGIVYRIYLYEWKQMNWLRKAKEVVSFWLISHSRHTDKVFILNDPSAVLYLNKLYKTDHFASLPDPFNEIDYKPKNIRGELGIKESQKMLLHFGGLSRRKGTITILDSIQLISEEKCKNIAFVFAGNIYDDIRDEFYIKYNQIRSKCTIVVFDGFCSNENLYDLCYSCDLILAPYSNSSQSSGIVNYANFFKKPVMGSRRGLLGKLIRKGHGITLDAINPVSLSSAISNFECLFNTSNFSVDNSNKVFADAILKNKHI